MLKPGITISIKNWLSGLKIYGKNPKPIKIKQLFSRTAQKKKLILNNIYNFELIFALLPTAAQLLPVVAAESAYMLVAGNNCFWALVLQIA